MKLLVISSITKVKKMSKTNKTSGVQGDLFAVASENPFVGFPAWEDDDKAKEVVILDGIDDDGVDHKKRVIDLAERVATIRGKLAAAIMAAQSVGYSDGEIKLWLLEAGWAAQSISNELSQQRIAKGERKRAKGGGRKVQNADLVSRIQDFAALILGEDEYDAKAVEAALHAAARLVKEGKVEAKKAQG